MSEALVLPDLSGRHVIITGANTGIGKETARGLAQAGAHVVLACRSAARARPVVEELVAETDNPHLSFMALDLGSQASVRAFAEAYLATGRPLHLLIGNAGIAGQPGQTQEGFEATFGVNHLGHFLLTELLLERLKASAPARVLIVSSEASYRARTIPFDKLQQPTWTTTGIQEYTISKLANVLHARELARRLEGSGVSVAAVHPGRVASDIWRRIPWPLDGVIKLFLISNEAGAQPTLNCCVSPEVEAQSGAFWNRLRVQDPNPVALDEALQDELARRSREWTGLA